MRNHNESEMALYLECMQMCVRKLLDTADPVRDGDLSPTMRDRIATLPRRPFLDNFRLADHSSRAAAKKPRYS